MKPTWHIELLGGLTVKRDGKPLPVGIGRPAALLAYLAFRSTQEHSRNLIAAALWPESEGDIRATLRTTLDDLRQYLGESDKKAGEKRAGAKNQSDEPRLLHITRDTLRLNHEHVTTDLRRYRDALRQAETAVRTEERQRLLQQAVNLYCGELLLGLEDAWALHERIQLAARQRSALEQLLALREQAGDWFGAINSALQIAGMDPYDVQAQANVLRLYLADNRVSEALEYSRKVRQAYRKAKQEMPAVLKEWEEKARKRLRDVNRCAALTQAHLRDSDAPDPAPFFGREQELNRLCLRLSRAETRMVTLTGPGGTGKTRLALTTAHRLQAVFPKRVYCLELADIQDASRIVEEVARMVLPSRHAKSPLLDQLAQQAGQARLLLVLDNFEHLVKTGAKIVEILLSRCPAWTVLVTSRIPLGVAQEITFAVPMLAPEPSRELFVYRAQLAQPEFALTEDNLGLVDALCAQLEGYPLAIELAAAWGRTTPLRQMRDLFTQRFGFLVRAQQNGTGRHDNLRVVIAWSYEQLNPRLQKFFAAMSVFRGSWSVEAAQAVWAGERKKEKGEAQQDTITADARLALLAMQENALVSAQEINGAMRFRMLETLREFAQEQLLPSERSLLADTHATYFMRLAHSAEPHLTGSNEKYWLDVLDSDRENLNSALDHLLEVGRPTDALQMASNLGRFWERRSHTAEGIRYLMRGLQCVPSPILERAQALGVQGYLYQQQGNYLTALPIFEEGLAIARELNVPGETARLLLSLGHNHMTRSSYSTARTLLQEGLSLFERLDYCEGKARSLHSLGSLAFGQGDIAEAKKCFTRSMALFQQMGASHDTARSLLNLGSIAAGHSPEQAEVLFRQSLEMYVELQDDWHIAVVKMAMGNQADRLGRSDEAWTLLTEALRLTQQTGARVMEGVTQLYMGDWHLRQQELNQAQACYERALTLLRLAHEFRRICQTLDGFARLSQARGEWARAARLFGASDALRQSIGAMLSATEHFDYDPAIVATRKVLGEEEYHYHWMEGQAYTPEQAIAYALQDNIDQA